MNGRWLEYSRYVAVVMGTTANYLLGGWDGVLKALVAFVALDYLTGVLAALAEKRLNPEIGLKGITKKVGLFVLVSVAHLLDEVGDLGEPILRTATCWFLIANEGLSVLENLTRVGVPVPAGIKDALERLRGRGEEQDAPRG